MIQSKIQEKQVYLHFYENFSAISAVYRYTISLLVHKCLAYVYT